jgi:hypothetical protein
MEHPVHRETDSEQVLGKRTTVLQVRESEKAENHCSKESSAEVVKPLRTQVFARCLGRDSTLVGNESVADIAYEV